MALTGAQRNQRYRERHPAAYREKHRLEQQEYRKKYPDRVRATCARWRTANKKYMATYMHDYYARSGEKGLIRRARERAKRKGIAFNITEKDIMIPDKCPVLGLRLEIGTGRAHDASPSLDRIRPNEGYVPGNIIVVSHRANTIKSNATVEELRIVASFYEQLGGI